MFSTTRFDRIPWLAFLFLATVFGASLSSESLAQSVPFTNSPSAALPSGSVKVDTATLEDLVTAAKEPPPANEPAQGVELISLLLKGGILLIPIAILSLFVVMFIIERFIGLRNGKMFPRSFVRKLVVLSRESESIDPRIAYQYCMEYPSAAASVVRAVLLRTGRPQQEIATAASEISQHEADKAHAGVRWLSFSSGVAPLLGLLGTVWGLIQAFHALSLLGPTQNRAEHLSRGIYEALVLTLTGLVIAIVASTAAHFFESRITRTFQKIEELVFALIPKLEKYERRVRFDLIGRELVARNIELAKKPTVATAENAKTPSPPPIQTTAIPSSPPHTASAVPTRKSIYKP